MMSLKLVERHEKEKGWKLTSHTWYGLVLSRYRSAKFCCPRCRIFFCLWALVRQQNQGTLVRGAFKHQLHFYFVHVPPSRNIQLLDSTQHALHLWWYVCAFFLLCSSSIPILLLYFWIRRVRTRERYQATWAYSVRFWTLSSLPECLHASGSHTSLLPRPQLP